MSLRERHKDSRRSRILEAATELFLLRGFDSVKAEEIADRAEVSVGTFYNYFGGKNELMLRLSTLENERVAMLAREYDVTADRPVAETFSALMAKFFQAESMMLRQDLWRKGFALAFADVKLPEARAFLSSDIALRQIVIDAARALQTGGRLRADLDCEAFGAALYNTANALFLEFTWDDAQTIDGLNARIASHTQALVSLAMARGPGQL